MDNYTNIEINGTSYKETYTQKTYFLYKNGEAVAIATNTGGLYIKGNKKDVLIWFDSLDVREV